MRKIISFSLLIVILLIISINLYAQTYQEDFRVIAMLKEFYTNYINAGNGEPSKTYVLKLEAIRKKYSTVRFYSLMKTKGESGELDWDPLIDAQDFNVKWLQTLSIHRDLTYSNRYTVSYTNDYDHKKRTINLIVTKVKEGYKIDNILLYDAVWLVQ